MVEIIGNFSSVVLRVLELTLHVNNRIIINIRLLTSPNIFRGFLYITTAQTNVVMRVPSHSTGAISPPALKVIFLISSDFLDFTMRVKRVMRLPSASIMPRSPKNSVETGLPKNCSFKRGKVKMAVMASLAGKLSIFPMAMEYLPWFWELNTFIL